MAPWLCAWCPSVRPSAASSVWCGTFPSSWARKSILMGFGGDTELDKSMVGLIADPLMHLVRNSMDHGLETRRPPRSRSKPAMGRLALNAYHDAGAVVIEVSDDGRGLARERIIAKAVERGLIAEGQVLPDRGVWQLIFHAGFSTAPVILMSGAGRGHGRGQTQYRSLARHHRADQRDGQGTLTQIRLPLTLAMIDGFLTMVGASTMCCLSPRCPSASMFRPNAPPKGSASAARSICAVRCCPGWTWRAFTASPRTTSTAP